jgi:protein TonB
VRERGAIAWKVLVAAAAVLGAVWAAARLSPDAPPREAVLETSAAPTPVTVAPPRETSATAAPPTGNSSANDPFAGVDLSNDLVLRHIAGIEEKKGGRAGVRQRPPAQAADAPARRPNEAAPVAREEPRPETKARQVAVPPAVVAAPVAASNDTPRVTTVPAQTPPPSEPAPVRASPETTPPVTAPAPVPSVTAASTTVAAVARPVAPVRIDPDPSTTTAAAAPLKIASRTVPQFPGEAIRAGVRSGRVVARLSIDADGRVTQTQVLSATPGGLFERETGRALSTWRYEPPGQATTTDVELIFTRE